MLNRPKFRKYVTLAEVRVLIEALIEVAEEVPDPIAMPVTRDPTDDYLVALALSAGADALVSGDADPSRLGRPAPTHPLAP